MPTHPKPTASFVSLMSRSTAAILLLIPLALSSCTTTYLTPMAVTQTTRGDVTLDQTTPSNQKTFLLPHDWQYNNWVIKKGSQITFYSDGIGEFEACVFSQFTTSPDEVHFQSIQFGKDGNRLFSFPETEVGYPLHIRASYQDFPYNVRFAFDPRFFDDINEAKFFARVRMKSENIAPPDQYSSHSSSSTHLDFDPKLN
jgi:hypothetical protein